MNLLIVESPTKVKTLSKLLDGNWDFAVTKGHMYDLPEEEMGLNDNYDPDWTPMDKRSIKEIKSKARNSDEIYLASDPDREGEAIAWQVEELVLENRGAKRIRLESLTESELDDRINNPDTTEKKLVEAQWARRILDRLAGYKISPFLMNAFKGKKLSAGRVQTPVLGKIVDRWKEVDSFEPETYYRVKFDWYPAGESAEENHLANLVRIDNRSIGTGDSEELLTDVDLANKIVDALNDEGVNLKSKSRDINESYPNRPFDSSSLIQTASKLFGWSAGQTMNTAQSLYEKGLITYHRSDSNRLARQACGKIAGYVKDQYGKEFHQWRGGGGGDQEGHEAIRPKYPGLEPVELHSVSSAERTLYSLIWQTTIRSQMVPAEWDVLTFVFEEAKQTNSEFVTEVRALKEPGFYRCLRKDETPRSDEELSVGRLDQLESLEEVEIEDAYHESDETSGPRLYTEGELVAMMKREGIGRPSTYSATISRLMSRQYIEKDEGKFLPTNRGKDVINFLRRAIPKICEVEFTEKMEETLDNIAQGNEDWRSFVRQFDENLEEWIESSSDVEPEGNAETAKEKLEYENCPRCGSDLFKRKGEYGEFVHCSDDDCDFSSNVPAKTYRCPECDRHMVKNSGNKSTVYHCIAAPDCDGKRPVGKPNTTLEEFRQEAPDCPECGESMVKRKGRYGDFWGCKNYPDCDGTLQMD